MITAIIAIARTSLRAHSRSRLNTLLLVFSLALLFVSRMMTSLSLNEDMRLMQDLGLFLVATLSVIASISLSAQSLYKELEKKSIFPLLSKPITRATLIIGKYIGLAMTLFIIVSMMALAWSILAWQLGIRISTLMWMAWILIWIESLIIAAVAMLIGSFSTPFVTASLSFGFLLVGRFHQDIVHVSHKAQRLGQEDHLLGSIEVILKIIPNLSLYSINEEILYRGHLPWSYVWHASVSGLSYAFLCLFLAILIFNRRDLV